MRDVVLGFDKLEDYLPEKHRSDFGAVIGRYANRLNNGQITIDGHVYQLPQNDGKHCLHGGPDGWQYRMFNVESVSDSRLVLSLVSEDGDSGFPGNVCARVTYMLNNIIKPQKFNDHVDTFYVHNHVLRAGINGNYGEYIISGGLLEKYGEYLYGYSLDFNGTDWNPDNCSVIAILLDEQNKKVIQVEKAAVR